jgi:dimethylamine/trimethylamine dehydrogenase
LIYDDDQIYLAGVLAQHLALAGFDVTFVTPASMVSPWTEMTLEQHHIQKSLMELGVDIRTGHSLTGIGTDHGQTACVYTDRQTAAPCDATLLVTERHRTTGLFDDLSAQAETGITTLELIGDAAAPGLIADAVYSGHMAARNFETDPEVIAAQDFARELIDLRS